jgi:predicted RNA binding protein YcfA (HicA-like mRNA interferase family)
MPRTSSDVEKGLEKKGFNKREGDHHFFAYYSIAGKKTRVFTKTSHGKKEIADNILSQMAKQCRLTNKQFNELIDCPLSQDDYEKILANEGLV